MTEGAKPTITEVMKPYMQQAQEVGHNYGTWQAYFTNFANGVAITNYEQIHRKGVTIPDARFRITTSEEAEMWKKATEASGMVFGIVAEPNETVIYRGEERTLNEGEFFIVAANISLSNGAAPEVERQHRLGQDKKFVASIREQGGNM